MKRVVSIVILSFVFFTGFPQSEVTVEEEIVFSAVPGGFDGIDLGMSLDTVKEKLKKNPNFTFRGDPDVSLLLRPNESLIECSGSYFIKRAFFQFHEKKLYIIILMLDPEKLDHFTVYLKLKSKYGNQNSLSPSEILWESEQYRFSLESPLTIKYIDKKVFNELINNASVEKSYQIMARDQFLDQF